MKIITKTEEFTDSALLEVEVGTTGLRGGDAGCGGRTYLRLKDNGGTDMEVHVTPGGHEIALIFGGDAELRNLIAGLQFAIGVLGESLKDGTQANVPTVGSRILS